MGWIFSQLLFDEAKDIHDPVINSILSMGRGVYCAIVFPASRLVANHKPTLKLTWNLFHDLRDDRRKDDTLALRFSGSSSVDEGVMLACSGASRSIGRCRHRERGSDDEGRGNKIGHEHCGC